MQIEVTLWGIPALIHEYDSGPVPFVSYDTAHTLVHCLHSKAIPCLEEHHKLCTACAHQSLRAALTSYRLTA